MDNGKRSRVCWNWAIRPFHTGLPAAARWASDAKSRRGATRIAPPLGLSLAAICALVLLPGIRVAAVPTVTPSSPATDAPPLPVSISPGDSHIRYVGRFDTRQPAAPRCAWSASQVELRFSGTALNVVLDDTGADAYEVVVDGKIAPVLSVHKGTAVYSLLRDGGAARAGQAHTVVLVKRTEPLVGTTQFLGFQLSAGGHLLPLPARRPHRLEVIGDSISCGYGNEAGDKSEHFSPATENAFLSYGAVAARTLDADYVCVAWSGRKMWPNNTVPEIYGLALPDDPAATWDFTRWVPDAVVINLGTNDFGGGNPDRAGWTTAYERFLARVRQNYPRAAIYCASGPMMSDTWPPGQQALSTLNSYLSQIVKTAHDAGDPNVHLLAFAAQTAENGYGADWHPSLKTHAVMADALSKTLDTDLGWRERKAARK